MAPVATDDSSGLGRMDQGGHLDGGGNDPFAVWREMREREGARVTLIKLYALVAEPRGLKPHELPLAERRELAGRATPLMWPGFEYNERSKPRERQAVEVVAYDQGWPERFETWRGRLAEFVRPGCPPDRARRLDLGAGPGGQAGRGHPGQRRGPERRGPLCAAVRGSRTAVPAPRRRAPVLPAATRTPQGCARARLPTWSRVGAGAPAVPRLPAVPRRRTGGLRGRQTRGGPALGQ